MVGLAARPERRRDRPILAISRAHRAANMEIITYSARRGDSQGLSADAAAHPETSYVMTRFSLGTRYNLEQSHADRPDLDHPDSYWRFALLGSQHLPPGRPLRRVVTLASGFRQ